MVQRISAQLSEAEAAALDAAVAQGRFASRSAAVRAGLAAVLVEQQVVDDDQVVEGDEVVEGELVVAEPAAVVPAERSRPARLDRDRALVLARRAALPLLGTGAAAVAARVALRRAAASRLPVGRLPVQRLPGGINVVIVLRRD